MYYLLWLVVSAVFFGIELLTMGLTTVWFAGGALVACLAGFLGAGVIWQIIIFLIVSAVLLIACRPFLSGKLAPGQKKTNIGSLIGKQAKVIEVIDNLNETGVVRLEGKEWTARTADDSIIEKDTVVVIESISGVKLIVKQA